MYKKVALVALAFITLLTLPLTAAATEYPLATPPNSPPAQAGADDWPMAGANPQRTSWTAEEVRGRLKPVWYKQFEPYISQKVQIIAANNMLYIATARGLYALDADTGAERWVYPTELPLGHSPTVSNGVVYVGGFDHKLHAINANTGQGLWTFEAGAGFETNPLVVGDKVFLGNRDGYFYAIYAEGQSQAGKLAWKYQTNGPILYSAAYNNGTIFFASNDSHAYALNANTGALVWKSAKLPGAGFRSWWPVIYKNRVIFSGSNNYRTSIKPGFTKQFSQLELDDVYPNHANEPQGTLVGKEGQEPGDWAAGTETIDMSKSNGTTTAVTEYFEEKPWRRTYFVLDQTTGQEITYDFDHDGKPEYAPILWVGTHSGNRYPPVIGNDGVLYQSNNFKSDAWIAGGHISGWKMDTPFISIPDNGWNAVDEPQAYAAGGNLIYWNRCCDRVAAAFDVSQPGTGWAYFSYDLDSKLPNYNSRYYNPNSDSTNPYASFGGPNGVYGFHADTNPPIPYHGKVYMHRSNAIIAFADTSTQAVALPMAHTVAAPSANVTPKGADTIKATLEQQVQKIVTAGHLRPGYNGHGIFDFRSRDICGDNLVDYWHNSSETIYTLTKAWPFLSSDLQQQVKTYLDNELANYPPYTYNHVGWNTGAAREIFDLPNDVAADLTNHAAQQTNYMFKDNGGWGRNPFLFYALWKYAATFGNAQALFDASKNRLESPPSDSDLLEKPHVHNAFIAGYEGYLELEKLAGYSETANVRTELNRLLSLRAANFSKDSAYGNLGSGNVKAYCRTLNVANNFMFLTPELADYLRTNAMSKVQAALDEYTQLAPYWFVSMPEEGFAENALNPLYDSQALFMARAMILQAPGTELEQYLDVPAFDRGDLYYIQKLTATLENEIGVPQSYGFILTVSPETKMVEEGGSAQYTIDIQPTGGFNASVQLSTGSVPSSLSAAFNKTTLTPPGAATLTITDLQPGTSAGTVQIIAITANGDGIVKNTNVTFIVSAQQVYLPLVMRGN